MRSPHTPPATIRRTILQRLYALAIVPYLLLALFGEGLHSHPLLAPDAAMGALQSTLGANRDAAATKTSSPSTSASHLTRHVVHEAATECLACAWQSQTVAQTVASSPLLWQSTRVLAPIPAHSSLLSFVVSPSRNRGPPLS